MVSLPSTQNTEVELDDALPLHNEPSLLSELDWTCSAALLIYYRALWQSGTDKADRILRSKLGSPDC